MLAIAETTTEPESPTTGGDPAAPSADVPKRTAPRTLRSDVVRYGTPVAIFLSGRLLTLAAAHAARLVNPAKGLLSIHGSWDAAWYRNLAENGYPTAHPPGVGDPAQSTLAFFPAFPILIRAVHAVTGISYSSAGILVNVVLGAAASVLIWLIAERVANAKTATRAIALFSFFPGSFILGMGYTEGLFLVCAGSCLLALMHERWLIAGLAAGVGTATRATGWVLCLVCAWAAFVVWRERRTWKPLIAPALSPLGLIAFSIYLWVHTGDPLMWRASQKIGWNQGFVTRDTLRGLWEWLPRPLFSFNILVAALTMAMVAVFVLAVVRWKWRLGSLLGIYTFGVLTTAMAVSQLNSTPRYVMPAFGAYIWVAGKLSETTYSMLLAVWAGGMAILMLMSGGTQWYTP